MGQEEQAKVVLSEMGQLIKQVVMEISSIQVGIYDKIWWWWYKVSDLKQKLVGQLLDLKFLTQKSQIILNNLTEKCKHINQLQFITATIRNIFSLLVSLKTVASILKLTTLSKIASRATVAKWIKGLNWTFIAVDVAANSLFAYKKKNEFEEAIRLVREQKIKFNKSIKDLDAQPK